VHPYAPRRPFRVHQDMRKGRRLPHDVLTLTSHTTDDKAPTDQAPEPPEGSATMTRSSSGSLAVNTGPYLVELAYLPGRT